jgi:putative (di)nucleoside polyphosphate hydrolase
MPKRTSCGVIVAEASPCAVGPGTNRILLGHATRSPRWDIPKGLAEPGETFIAAALRELCEETGLVPPEADLRPLGVHAYLRDKDLALFAWIPTIMPAPDTLSCRSTFTAPNGAVLPEFDRFGLFALNDALRKVGRNLARILAAICSRGGGQT